MKLATEDFDRISKALADPQRRAILQKLAMTGKLNCSDVGAFFDVSQPTVSHHLKELATAHVVEKEFRKNYRSLIYSRKKNRSEQSNLEKIYSEEVEVARRHPHPADKTGFS